MKNAVARFEGTVISALSDYEALLSDIRRQSFPATTDSARIVLKIQDIVTLKSELEHFLNMIKIGAISLGHHTREVMI